MLARVYRSEPIVYESVLCEYEAPFDENGVLYHIATAGRTREWTNPHVSGEVVAAMSSEADPLFPPDRFVVHRVEDCQGEYPGNNCTDNHEPNSWMSVDLGEGRSLVPRHYCLRHGRADPLYVGHTNPALVLRTWRLQGSQDRQEWHTLRLHENDQSLAAAASSVAGWAVEAGGREYRHFRVLQHGKNSSGFDFLVCCGIELYGELFLE